MTQIINKSKEWSRWNEYWYLIIYLSLTKLTEIHRVDENKKKKTKDNLLLKLGLEKSRNFLKRK